MVRLFFQFFTTLALISGSTAKPHCTFTDPVKFGGTGGVEFDDLVNMNTRITHILARSHKRLDAIGILADGVEPQLHGGEGGKFKKYDLNGKTIIEFDVHRVDHDEGQRIVGVNFRVNNGTNIWVGGKNDPKRPQSNIQSFKAPMEGSYLLGFTGKAEKEVDSLAGIWLDTYCKNKEAEDDKDSADGDYDEDD